MFRSVRANAHGLWVALFLLFPCSSSTGETLGVETVGTTDYPNDGLSNGARIQLQRDESITCGFANRAGTFGWFGLYTEPGGVVKVDLSDPDNIRKVETLALRPGENLVGSCVIDGDERYGYFGTNTEPARIVKVDLETMTRVDAITLPEGESKLQTAVIHPSGTVAYFGTRTAPASIIEVDLVNFQRTRSLPLPALESNLLSAVVDASGEFGYFGCDVTPPRIVKVRLQDLARVSSLSLTGVGTPRQGIIDPTGLFGYFCCESSPGQLIRIDLTDFTQFDVLNLPAGVNQPFSMLINGGGTHAMLGLSNGRVASVDLVNFTYIATSAKLDRFGLPLYVAVRPADLPETGFFASSDVPSIVVSANITTRVFGAPYYLEAEQFISSAVVDHDGRYAYFTTYLEPPRVVKIDLEKGKRVGSILLDQIGSGGIRCSAIDGQDKYAFFGMDSSATGDDTARLYALDLDSFSYFGAAAADMHSTFSSIAFDESGARAWIASRTTGPSPQIKVYTFDPTQFILGGDDFEVTSEPGFLKSAVYDPTTGNLFFGTDQSPARAVYLFTNFLGVDVTSFGPGYNSCNTLLRNPANDLLYAGFGNSIGIGYSVGSIQAFRPPSPTAVFENASVTTDGGIHSCAFVDSGQSGLFATNGSVLKMDASLSTVQGKLKLPIGEDGAVGLVVPPEGDRAWYGSDGFTGIVGQINLFPRDQVKATKIDLPTTADVSSVSFYTHAAVGPRRSLVERFPRGSDAPTSVAFDRANGHALYGTATFPGQIIRFDTANMTVVATATLKAGSDDLQCAFLEPDGLHACFGTFTTPGRVIRVRTSDLGVEGSIDLNSGEDNLTAAGLEPSGAHGYFAASSSPARIVKVQLDPVARVGALLLEVGEELPKCLLVDPAGEFAYLGCGTSPGQVVKIQLSDFTRVGSLPFETGEDFVRCGSIDPTGTFAYFGTDTLPAKIIKVQLSDFTRVDALTLEPEEVSALAMDIDPTGERLVVGLGSYPAQVAVIDLATFSRVGAATLRELESAITPALAIDAGGQFAYLGMNTSPGRVVRIELAPKPLRLGIYGNSGDFKQILWQSPPVPLSASETWVDVPISQGDPASLILPPDEYWLAWQVDASTDAASYIPGASGEGFSLYWPAGPFPSSVTAETSTGVSDTTETWSIYISYDEAPAATPTETETETPTETETETPTVTPSPTEAVDSTETPTPSSTPEISPTIDPVDYDVVPDPPDGRIDARDLLEWFNDIQDGSPTRDLLFDFSRFWQFGTK